MNHRGKSQLNDLSEFATIGGKINSPAAAVDSASVATSTDHLSDVRSS